MSVRVVVIDDQTLVRAGIIGLLGLSDAVEVVGEAADGRAGLEVIEQARPDVVLLDLRMPVLDGIGVLEALAARGGGVPEVPVLVLTTFADDEALLAALRAGARGYLLKDVNLETLVEAVESLAAGETRVQPSLTDALVRSLGGRVTVGAAPGAAPVSASGSLSDPGVLPPEPLTPREVEVLRLLSGGYSNREIAVAMHLAEGTVKNHVSAVLLKLGVRDRTRAVLKALELGLLT